MSTFIVTFINKDLNSKADNVLRIMQNDDSYTWSYKDAELSYSHMINLYSSHAVYDRLETLLDMVYYDSQPVEFVQVEVPAFPTIIFPHSDLKNMRRTVLDALYLTMKAWPNADLPRIPDSPPIPDYLPTPRKHLFFDDC